MSKGLIKTLAIASAVLQAVSLIAIVVVTIFQHPIVSATVGFKPEQTVFPVYIILSEIVNLLICLILVAAAMCYGKIWANILVIIGVAAKVIFGIADIFLAMGSNAANASKGVDYIAPYSALSSAIGIVKSPLAVLISALFFLTAGILLATDKKKQINEAKHNK